MSDQRVEVAFRFCGSKYFYYDPRVWMAKDFNVAESVLLVVD